MQCFSLEGIKNFIIWFIVVCAVVAILRLILPILLGWLGVVISPFIMRIINIILVAVVLIFLVVILFNLAECALGGGLGFATPHRVSLYAFYKLARL
jgi:uncharacterized membrane protein